MESITRASGAARGVGREFREFLLKQNVVALAAGVVIGAAVGKVVTGIVDDLVMPITSRSRASAGVHGSGTML